MFYVLLDPWLLRAVLDRRPPRQLPGDYRTAKSNAMTPVAGTPDAWLRMQLRKQGRRVAYHSGPYAKTPSRQERQEEKNKEQKPNELGLDLASGRPRKVGVWALDSLYGNPNRGATRVKTFDMPKGWRQVVRIERHRLHARLAQHFFICPRAAGGCGHRMVKLYLPLATEAEIADAARARAWLTATGGYDTDFGRRLQRRYGFLLGEPGERRLLCRHCWGMRYGEAKGNC